MVQLRLRLRPSAPDPTGNCSGTPPAGRVCTSQQHRHHYVQQQWRPLPGLSGCLAAAARRGRAAQLCRPMAAVARPALDVLADAGAAAASAGSTKGGGMFGPLSDSLEAVLKVLQGGLQALHVPYSYGFSIILLTLLVKAATYPFTKQQVESSLAMQSLKPRIDAIKARYGEDKEKVQKETSRLYEKAGVNPLAGCLPSLATIPIFIGLYRSLTNVASEGLLENEGFFWIPSLAGPTSIAARAAGSGTAWLYPFVDGHPPIGWDAATRYCALPALLIVVQYASTSVISPPVDPNAENAKVQKAIVGFLPLMVGWFALNVPSGLSLYYMSNTVLTSAIQIWLRKLGGASVTVNDLGPVTQLGSARRTGVPATPEDYWSPPDFAALTAAPATPVTQEPASEAAKAAEAVESVMASRETSSNGLPQLNTSRRCKRKRLQPAPASPSTASA